MSSEHAPARDDRGRWLPGASPNPGGRPRSIRKQLLERLGPEKLDKVSRLLADAIDSVDRLDVEQELPPVLEWFLDREYPKPKAVEISGPEGEPLSTGPVYDVSRLTVEDRAKLAEIQAKLITSGDGGGEE